MWKFWQKEQATSMPVSEKLRLHLATERGLSSAAVASLRMIEQRGRYSGRKVTYFRIFDPIAVKAAGADAPPFDDLHFAGLHHTGHTESDGQIILNQDR